MVTDPCSMVYQFAKDEASFSTCAIVSGNNMCKMCVAEILKLTNSFTKLMGTDSLKRINDSKCMEDIATDTVRDRYGAYYTNARTMWFTNNCDSEWRLFSSSSNNDSCAIRLLCGVVGADARGG